MKDVAGIYDNPSIITNLVGPFPLLLTPAVIVILSTRSLSFELLGNIIRGSSFNLTESKLLVLYIINIRICSIGVIIYCFDDQNHISSR